MKHLYKISILLLLAILPVSAASHYFYVNGVSPQQNKAGRSAHFLLGDISIETSSNLGIPGEVDINVFYSGDEDVLMNIFLNGHLLASIHSNEWSIQDYWSDSFAWNTIEVEVIADGFFDLHGFSSFNTFLLQQTYCYLIGEKDVSYVGGNCYAYGDTLTYDLDLFMYCKVYSPGDLIWRETIWQGGVKNYYGDMTIPSSLSVIGNYAFNVYTGDYLIGEWSWWEDNTFGYLDYYLGGSLTIPSSIVAIENNAFGNDPCFNYKCVPYRFHKVIIEDLASWCAIDFKGSKCNPLLYANQFSIANQNVNNLVIPETISVIRSYAFAGCPGVNSVILPISVIYGRQVFWGSSVQSLILTGDGAFQEGSLDMNAANVYIGNGITDISGIKVKPTDVYSYSNTPPICDENTFTDYSGTLHVPASALAAYFTAPYWNNFINIVGDVIEPKSMSIDQDTISIRPGMTQELVATLIPTNATGAIIWDSTKDDVAKVVDGKVTAIAQGECDIFANCSGYQASCHVIVSEIKPTAVVLSQENVQMETSTQLTLSATVLPDSTTDKTVIWSSTDENIATVNKGLVTAVSAGECDIIARCQDVQAICHVTVIGVLPTAIILDQENALMKIGSELILSASVLPENTTFKIVTWSSSDENIATVNNGIVTAVGTGMCDIVAQCRDLQAVCHVTVAQLALDQHEAQLLPNHILTLEPVVSSVIDNLNVSSSNPSVAAVRMVNGKVQVVGIKEGYATIIVNWVDNDVFSDSCLVEVYTERGDVNCDGFVNISDVTTLIDVLLGGETPHSDENADCNADSKITISDVTALIDALLSGEPLPDKDSQVYNVNGVSFKMVKVKGGTFMMGATAGQGNQAYDDEFPVHEVILSSYCIGETEVTQALWQAVMGENPSNFKGDLNRPVEMVSWYDCQTFITKLNQMTGKSFRLPTEAEWEFAARGGNLSHDYMYAGSNNLDEVAWAYSNIPSQQPNTEGYGTQPVAQKMPNELGLYDMSGNVYEWCNDWFDIYSSSVQLDPTGPGDDMDCHYRVNRGGGWNRYGRSCRVSLRNNPTPESAAFNYGLRLAM